MQAADMNVEDSSEKQDRQLVQPGAGQPEGTEAIDMRPEAEEEQEEQEEEALPAGYISRRTTDPYMQKKLRGIQVSQPVPAPSCKVVNLGDRLTCMHLCSNAGAIHACSDPGAVE